LAIDGNCFDYGLVILGLIVINDPRPGENESLVNSAGEVPLY
jgi:hypothetical protein